MQYIKYSNPICVLRLITWLTDHMIWANQSEMRVCQSDTPETLLTLIKRNRPEQKFQLSPQALRSTNKPWFTNVRQLDCPRFSRLNFLFPKWTCKQLASTSWKLYFAFFLVFHSCLSLFYDQSNTFFLFPSLCSLVMRAMLDWHTWNFAHLY